MEKFLINDSRITADMERVRSSVKQLFRRKGLDNKFTTEDNADVILIPERRELFAELIDGQWYWVNGCAKCNGKLRDWMSYIECEEHDVCRTCGISRKKLKDIPYAGRYGWQCQPCSLSASEDKRQVALESVAVKKYDEQDYLRQDKVICPHCGNSYEPDSGTGDGKEVCELCGGEYELEVEYSATYSTTVVGERITA